MVRYRVLRRKDVPEVQSVALKAWKFAYRRYGLSLKLIQKFVLERYSTDSFEKTVLASIKKGEAQFYLATDKGKIIGYSNTGPGVWGWELYRIYLLPEYIGKGVGKRLLLLCEDFLQEKRLLQARRKEQEQSLNMHREKTDEIHAFVSKTTDSPLILYRRKLRRLSTIFPA